MIIEIQIELIIIILIAGVLLLWAFWYRLSRWWARRRYNPDNDKSKKGEEKRRRELGSGEGRAVEKDRSVPGPDESTERGSLPSSDVSSSRKNRKGPRGIFGRRRRTRK